MQQVALGWLVYRLTSSAFLLGLVGFAGQIPSLFLAPVAGVWVDRWDRRRLVIATQALGMVQALALAVLVLSGSAAVWPLVVLSLFLGIVNAFDVPARQNGASYAAVLAALVAIRVPPRPVSEGPRGSPWRSLREGVAYVSALSSVRSLLLLMGVVSLAGPTRC